MMLDNGMLPIRFREDHGSQAMAEMGAKQTVRVADKAV